MKTTAALLFISIFSVTGCEKNSEGNTASISAAKDTNVSPTIMAVPAATAQTAPGSGGNETAAGVTLENFNKLSKGMTVAEIKKIIGSEGKLISEGGNPGYKMSMYQWKNGKNNISCMFQNDIMISKTQFGL